MGRPREFDMEQTLDAAMDVFWAKGFEATSMADLMDATGLHKGSIYKAFRDKHDLFVQSLKRYLASAFESFHSVLNVANSPEEGFRELLRQAARSCDKDDCRRGCFAVNVAVELAHQDDEVAEMMKKHFHRMEALFAQNIVCGQEAGQFRDDLSAEELAEAFSVYLSGMLARAKGPHSRRRTRRLADCWMQLLAPV